MSLTIFKRFNGAWEGFQLALAVLFCIVLLLFTGWRLAEIYAIQHPALQEECVPLLAEQEVRS